MAVISFIWFSDLNASALHAIENLIIFIDQFPDFYFTQSDSMHSWTYVLFVPSHSIVWYVFQIDMYFSTSTDTNENKDPFFYKARDFWLAQLT